MGQQFFQGEGPLLSGAVETDDLDVGGKLPQHLAAHAAGDAELTAPPAITMRTKSRCPSLTALATAVRSAQMVGPKEAFSMLQPVNTVPSLHSRAAPTGKWE